MIVGGYDMGRAVASVLIGAVLLVASAAPCAAGGSVFGGRLLEEGDVSLTFGAGYPGVLAQMDFANSDRFNMAAKASLMFALGTLISGLNLRASFPMRISLMRGVPFSLALRVEPGLSVARQFESTYFGGKVGVEVDASYRLLRNLELFGGLGVPAEVTVQLGTTRAGHDKVGFYIPILLVVGAGLRVSDDLQVFMRVAAGPALYLGNLSQNRAGLAATSSTVGAAVRVFAGIQWRR